jgi:hypothetical protein
MPVTWRGGTRYSVPAPRGYLARRWFAEVAAYGATNSVDGPRGDGPYATADALVGVGIDLGCRRAGFFTVGVTNLLDVDYFPPGCVLPAPGLSLITGLELKF